jgi:hypothetical protein
MRAHRIGLLLCGAAFAFAATACSGGDDTSERPVLDVGEQGAGTCLDVRDDLPAEVTKLPVIDCARPHTDEIYAVVDYDRGDVFPGLEELGTFAEQVCVREFEPYVGTSAFDSSLSFTYLTPTLGSWNDQDDRAVLCVLRDGQAASLTGSMKGSGR